MTSYGAKASIQTINLTKRYDDFLALDRLNLSVESGQIFGLLGPNGAGKSTAIKLMTTLLDPSSGSAKVAGFDVATQPLEVRRRIGYVPQLLSADGGLTAVENLTLSARLYGLRGAQLKHRIQEAVEFADITDVAHALVRTYSGGMVRRLELAQAILHEPDILFLDEPTIGLDPVARRTVWERLLELQERLGMTILLTTHDMEEADYLCNTLAFLHQGQLAVVGSPRDLKSQVGLNANLSDVFAHVSGVSLEHGDNFKNAQQNREAYQARG
jgi:ABC-2 type transport system ATP-binding protein